MLSLSLRLRYISTGSYICQLFFRFFLEKYKKVEDKLIISKFFDKIELCKKTNKIETTDFLNDLEQKILIKVARMAEVENCIFYGGNESSDRKIAIIYPEKMTELFENNSFKYGCAKSAEL